MTDLTDEAVKALPPITIHQGHNNREFSDGWHIFADTLKMAEYRGGNSIVGSLERGIHAYTTRALLEALTENARLRADAQAAQEVAGIVSMANEGLTAQLAEANTSRERARADAQAAVALVVERAAKTLESRAELLVQDEGSWEPDTNVTNLPEWAQSECEVLEESARLIRDLADTDGLAMVEALRKERDEYKRLAIAENLIALEMRIVEGDRDRLAADLAAAQAQIEALSDALEELKQWADAYPTKVFPEPDLARAAAILSQGGMSLDVISASNMRHVLTRVAQITRSALTALPAKEGE